MIRTQVLKHLPEAREEGAKKMPGEERLPEERLRKIGMSESFKKTEMTQSNTFSPRGSEVPFESQRG